MCEFCLKHGDGGKWYLQAKNYSDDLLSDARRRRFIEEFADPARVAQEVASGAARAERLKRAPRLVQHLVSRLVTHKMKQVHFGQVVPIEEIEEIFDFTNTIVRVACICRRITLGAEKRYCYGVSLAPNGGKLAEILRGLPASPVAGPDGAHAEPLTKAEALEAFRAHEREGLCHTVWTFHTPFIGGVCNCDRTDCMAMRSTITNGTQVMFRAEYVAAISPDRCSGCRECMPLCQFGALAYSPASRKVGVDQRWCYGCGVCRAVCKKDAIRLTPRAESPAAAGLW